MVWTIVFVIQDEKGKRSSFSVNVPRTLDIAHAIDFGIQLASLIDPLIKGKIVSASVTLSLGFTHELPNQADPVAGGDVEEKGYFQFLTDQSHFTSISLPTFDEALVVAGSNEIDTSNAAVVAFLQAMTVGLPTLVGEPEADVTEPCDSRGETITALLTALETFTSSGKARR